MSQPDSDEWVTMDERKQREVKRTPVCRKTGKSEDLDILKDADGYVAGADGYVYVLKFIRTDDDELFYYVGMTEKPNKRIGTHISEFRAKKPLVVEDGIDYSKRQGSYEFEEIDRILSFYDRGNLRDVMMNKERKLAYEIAIEEETTNVLGGK